MKVPLFLFDTTLRFTVLRIIWISAVANVGAAVYYLNCPGNYKSTAQLVLIVATPTVIFLHHVLSAFGRYLSLPLIFDILLTLTELIVDIVVLCSNNRKISWRYQPNDFWLRIVTYYTLAISLGVFIILKTSWAVDAGPRAVLHRMDIRRERAQTSNTDIVFPSEKVGRKPKEPWWILAGGALIGRAVWRKKLAGESRSLAVSRGIIFVVLLAALVGFSFLKLVTDPISELAMGSSKLFLMQAIPWGMPPLTADNKWVIRAKQPTTRDNTMFLLGDAVKVYPLWESPNNQPTPNSRRSLTGSPGEALLAKRQGSAYSTVPIGPIVGPPSTAVRPTTTAAPTTADSSPSTSSSSSSPSTTSTTTSSTGVPGPTQTGTLALDRGTPQCVQSNSVLESVIYNCPPRTQLNREEFLNVLDHGSPDNIDNALPDLLVVVDFSALGKDIQNSTASGINVRSHSVHVWLALTDIVDEIEESVPVTLVPGMHLLGVVDLVMRQRLTHPALSSFGWSDTFETSMVANMAYVVTDPQASLLDVPVGPNIATLRLSARNKASMWRVRQDYREKSVLSGISAVGGLGSFFGTLFMVLFGTSLLGVVFGIRPISPFGLAHTLNGKAISTASEERYTSLRKDIESVYAKRGIMKYIFDTLIDLDIIVANIIHREPLPETIQTQSDIDDNWTSVGNLDEEIQREPTSAQPLMGTRSEAPP